MGIPLFEKYRPKKFADIVGQEDALRQMKIYFSAFSRNIAKKKALLLNGPAGTGKTTLAIVLAEELGYEIFELNASDLRNRAKLEEVLKPSIQQRSLFAKGKIILVDEVDGVTATDRGGLPELIALIEKTKFPIIVTANDIWQQKYSLLRKKVELVSLKAVDYTHTLELLKKVAKLENSEINEDILKGIASKCQGDLRGALNDLQSVLYLKGEINQENIGEREKTTDIFHAMQKVFKLPTEKEITKVYDNVNIEMDQIVLWIEKNIPKEYSNEELFNAFDALSKADLFKGRIYRQQHWRFLAYQNFFLSAGISAASKEKNPKGFTKYVKPTRILKIWMANQKNGKKKTIAAKYAHYTHISKKRALREFFMIALNLNNCPKVIEKIQLTDQEKDFLTEYVGALKVGHGLNKFALNN